MKTPTPFEEIEFALENPEAGLMDEAQKALENLTREHAALVEVAKAAAAYFEAKSTGEIILTKANLQTALQSLVSLA